MHLFVCGYPSDVGGANTELWHSVKLWRQFGVEVTLVPTWKADPVWRRRLDGIGCRTFESNPDDLQNVPGLSGGIVVSMCNTRFLAVAERFRGLGCKIIWLGCMNWLFPDERLHYRQCGSFDRHVFQSRYQRDQLSKQLVKFGYDDARGVVIRGAFDISEFPFQPRAHRSGETFVIGRLSRAAPEKFSPRVWQLYGRLRVPIAARVMGWAASVQARVGAPPRWAQCLPAGAETARSFLASLHCLAHAGSATAENWPRVGLEAMAAGVPLVVDNRGGWAEMVCHGETGLLCGSEDEAVEHITRLARDPQHRQEIAHQARHVVEMDLAAPEAWWQQWQNLLQSL